MSTNEYRVTLRVVLLAPPRDILYCLEDNQGSFVSTTKSTGDDIRFDFSAVVKPNQRSKKPNFTGPFCRGTPAKRFFYINWSVRGTSRHSLAKESQGLAEWLAHVCSAETRRNHVANGTGGLV